MGSRGFSRSPCLAGFGLLIFFLLIRAPAPARADIAPPESPPGTNPLPGNETTQVRMVAETVTLQVKEKSAGRWLGQAQVTAVFQMRNLGSLEERMDVRFPLTYWNGSSDGFGNFPEIAGLQVKVDGKTVPTRRVTTDNSSDFNDQPISWSAFDVTFPPEKPVQIEVSYTADGFGEYPFLAFRYVIETGEGWKDTIGSADFIVRLPYEANQHNVVFISTGFSGTTPGAELAGNEIRWHFENLEPGSEDNLEISLIVPELWKRVLADRQIVAKNPQDGEAWGRLGKAYKEMSRLRRELRMDEGGQELYRMSAEAYEKSVTLKPDDALWHYGYADLLWFHYYGYVYWEGSPDTSELEQVVHLLKRSLELDPGNVRALELLEEIQYSVEGSVEVQDEKVDYLILTTTPAITPWFSSLETPTAEPTAVTLTPAPSGTATPFPTQTPAVPPVQEETQTPPGPGEDQLQLATHTPLAAAAGAAEPVQRSRLPLCSAPFALPLAAFLFYLRKSRLH